mmetsp:Transcript_38991/g.58858  ORF Transcript_38991/g.58858 Transcript_38991/m.58858 type:complete len:86 (-) Transcript_38991:65-322(-)
MMAAALAALAAAEEEEEQEEEEGEEEQGEEQAQTQADADRQGKPNNPRCAFLFVCERRKEEVAPPTRWGSESRKRMADCQNRGFW